MEGMRLLRTLRLENFLSYGPEGTQIDLQPLNVLIGPNATGKSNLIEAIGLLRAAPTDISAPIRTGGGIDQWRWKGEEEEESSGSEESLSIDIEIETTVSYPKGPVPLRYKFRLASVGQRLELADEVIENETITDPRKEDVLFFYRYQRGNPVLNVREKVEEKEGEDIGRRSRSLQREDISPTESVLSQRKDPDHYPELTYLGKVFSEICLFRSCNLGHESPLRGPQAADQPASFLLENGSNLGMVLNDLLNRPPAKRLLLDQLERFCEYFEDITTKIYAGRVETYLHERGLFESVPSTRLSDGTLRYLYLLTILCHPSPPPLVCIEDPEIGLHPDVLPAVAELLVKASQKTQLVVTTHSDVLVSALGDLPEAVIVCERDDEGTHLRRLEPKRLEAWLEKYSLGELWRMGETGGNP